MAAENNEIVTKEKTDITVAEAAQVDIRSLIYVVRGQQVMIDSDLAMLYQVETKVLNQAVKRNISRFPDRFRFQLTKEEFENLKSQIVTSSLYVDGSGYGGRRKLPFAFTEQGISMLYHSLWKIEESFRITKSYLDARPAYVQKKRNNLRAFFNMLP